MFEKLRAALVYGAVARAQVARDSGVEARVASVDDVQVEPRHHQHHVHERRLQVSAADADTQNSRNRECPPSRAGQ